MLDKQSSTSDQFFKLVLGLLIAAILLIVFLFRKDLIYLFTEAWR